MVNNDVLKAIKVIVFDVDGVLTDGKIYLINDEEELKSFCARDLPRIRAFIGSGGKVILFTGRKVPAVIRRVRELKADILFKGDLKEKKVSLFEELERRYGVRAKEVLYVGDDWNDLAFMKQAGIAVTPENGSPENKEIAHIITQAKGGEGVAAEIIELVMRAQETWVRAIEYYLAND